MAAEVELSLSGNSFYITKLQLPEIHGKFMPSEFKFVAPKDDIFKHLSTWFLIAEFCKQEGTQCPNTLFTIPFLQQKLG